ncbi:MAG: unsaturated rhamnogalacturonyl hydrolase, partial [Streptomyces sp.]|nr:unsaturated rhamnogalacturonyl hydrolase [Streptomyces sp.]
MRRRQFLAASAALAAPLSAWSPASAAAAVRLPTRADVVSALRLVADHWIGANSDPGDNQWARATFFSGLMALHRLTGEP